MLRASQTLIEGDVGLTKVGWMTAERWAQSIAYLATNGLIDKPLHSSDVMTNSLMEQADALTT